MTVPGAHAWRSTAAAVRLAATARLGPAASVRLLGVVTPLVPGLGGLPEVLERPLDLAPLEAAVASLTDIGYAAQPAPRAPRGPARRQSTSPAVVGAAGSVAGSVFGSVVGSVTGSGRAPARQVGSPDSTRHLTMPARDAGPSVPTGPALQPSRLPRSARPALGPLAPSPAQSTGTNARRDDGTGSAGRQDTSRSGHVTRGLGGGSSALAELVGRWGANGAGEPVRDRMGWSDRDPSTDPEHGPGGDPVVWPGGGPPGPSGALTYPTTDPSDLLPEPARHGGQQAARWSASRAWGSAGTTRSSELQPASPPVLEPASGRWPGAPVGAAPAWAERLVEDAVEAVLRRDLERHGFDPHATDGGMP